VSIRTSSSTSTTATNIDVQLASIVGSVTAISGDTITVTDVQGFSRTIVVSSSTTYTKDNATSSLSAISVGTVISARGTVDANETSLDASSVTIGQLGGPSFSGSSSGGSGGAPMGGPGHGGRGQGGPGHGPHQ